MSTVNQHIDGNGNILSGSGDVQSNSFDSHGGPQNVAQGTNPIGQQNNYYNSPSVPQPVIPRQIPALEPCFLHRKEELAWLNDRLHPGKVAAVCGPGGMGKSALAAQAVHQLEPARFPDGIIFHSFYHQPKVETALQAICAAFQVEAKAGLETAVRNALSGKQALLILDGAEEADDLPALLKLRGTCGVLITSRKRTDALADRLDLKPLDEQPAAEVFRLYSGVAADDAGVQGICTLLGGWPVALRIAGRYLSTTGESAADYLRWLEQEPFKELAGGQHQEENAALLLRRSVAQVSDDARLALGLAGCLAFAPLSLESVAVVLRGTVVVPSQGFWAKLRAAFLLPSKQDSAEDAHRARSALNELVTYGLLEKREERWQVNHALIHTYAHTELALSKEKLERLAAYYTWFCETQSEAGMKGYTILDGERVHCLRLMESCLADGLWQEVKDLAKAISDYLDRQGYWIEELSAVNMRGIAARQLDDLKDEGWCLNRFGCIYHKYGEHENALDYFEQSLLTYRGLGDRKAECAIIGNIGNICIAQGNDEQAIRYLQQSLIISQEIGDRESEGAALHSIGFLYRNQGDYEAALQYYKQALAMVREAGDKRKEGTSLNNIAVIYQTHGEEEKALNYHEQGLAIRLEIGDRAGEMQSRWNIGGIYINLSNLTKAEEYVSLAVQIAEQIGHPDLEEYREGLKLIREKRQG